MKNIFTIAILSIMMIGCKSKPCPDSEVVIKVVDKEVYTINESIRSQNDSLTFVIKNLSIKNDSIVDMNKKLANELLHKKLVIENAKYYVSIVNKNRTQDKFLLGWMNRALNQ